MRPGALVYFYRRRLRVHAVPELLAGLGVAIAVALVLAASIASSSIAGSAAEVVHAVVGPASLQLRARSADGFQEGLLKRVERLPGVEQAAPLLEQTATIRAPDGNTVTVDLAGADTSLVVLDGLAHKLPIATLSPGGLGLSRTTAEALGLSGTGAGSGTQALGAGTPTHPAGTQAGEVTLDLRGQATPIRVSAVLGPETFGALSQAHVAVMPLADLQRLPFTVKADLREHYPFGMFARPCHELARLHASSGTTGKPTVVGYTRQDSAFHQPAERQHAQGIENQLQNQNHTIERSTDRERCREQNRQRERNRQTQQLVTHKLKSDRIAAPQQPGRQLQ